MSRRPHTQELSISQRERYEQLLRVADADALHDLLVRHGPAILDRDLPYLVVAARNRLRSTLRRGAASRETPTADLSVGKDRSSLSDPLDRVLANEQLRGLLEALSELDPRDLLILWSHAAGRSDAEIAARWEELRFGPERPSVQSIRKRRQRVRAHLRERLDLANEDR